MHAGHFAQGAVFVRHVAQPESDADEIELAAGKRQRFGVARHGGQGQTGVEQAVAPRAEHGFVDVGEHDLPADTGLFGEGARQIARAARNIEHALAGLHVGQFAPLYAGLSLGQSLCHW